MSSIQKWESASELDICYIHAEKIRLYQLVEYQADERLCCWGVTPCTAITFDTINNLVGFTTSTVTNLYFLDNSSNN